MNFRNVAHRTESLADSILLVEFWAGLGNDLDTIPMDIGNNGEPHRLTSMTKAFPSIPKSCNAKTKKPTWRNMRRSSATSAYSSTSPPAKLVALHPVNRRPFIVGHGMGNAIVLDRRPRTFKLALQVLLSENFRFLIIW